MKKFLIVVDMQNDFIDGALGTKEALAIVPGVVEKIGAYDPDCVYATRDTHGEDYLKTREGEKLPVPHCIRGTEGWEVRREVAGAMPGAVYVNKPLFGSTELARLLKERLKEDGIAEREAQIELIGLCTDICVVSNALLVKARLPEVPLTVDASCCAGVTPEAHQHALAVLRSCLITVEE